VRPIPPAPDAAMRGAAKPRSHKRGLLAALILLVACAASPVVDGDLRDPSSSESDDESEDGAYDPDDESALDPDDDAPYEDEEPPYDDEEDARVDVDPPDVEPDVDEDAGLRDAGRDAGSSVRDAGSDASTTTPRDAGVSAPADAGSRDAGTTAPHDAGSPTPTRDAGSYTPPTPSYMCTSAAQCAESTCPQFGVVPCCKATGQCGCRRLATLSCN